MSNYSTYKTKDDISDFNARLLNKLFNALFVASQNGIKTNHSPKHGDGEIVTLDVYQVQQAIADHSETHYSYMDIIGALQQLDYPKCLLPVPISCTSQAQGHRIDAVRLQYKTENQADNTCDAALNTWKERMEFNWKQTPKNLWPEFKLDISDDGKEGLDICDASRRWIARALELEHQVVGDKETISKLENTIDMLNCEIDEMTDSNLSNQKLAKDWKDKALHIHENLEIERMTSQALRITVKELLETIQAADKEARISLPSAVLLKLLDGANEFIDTPF